MSGPHRLQRAVTPLLLCSCMLLSQACASPPAAGPAHLAVMIEFASPTDGAKPALLASLVYRTGAAVHYRAAVSPNRHAYRLDCAVGDPDCRHALSRLATDPRIRSISLDRLRTPNQDIR